MEPVEHGQSMHCRVFALFPRRLPRLHSGDFPLVLCSVLKLLVNPVMLETLIQYNRRRQPINTYRPLLLHC